MTPISLIQLLLKVDKPAARFILAGVGVLAGAAIVSAFGMSYEEAFILAGFVLVYGALAYLMLAVFSDSLMRKVLSWALTVCLVAWLGGFMVTITGAVVIRMGLVSYQNWPLPACYVRMLWEPQHICEQRFAPTVTLTALDTDRRLALAATGPAAWALALAPTPAQYTRGPIYLQFAPEIPRAEMIALAATLEARGWPLQGGAQGGEELANARGYDEVRFFDTASRDDAFALGRTLVELRPGRPMSVKDLSRAGFVAPAGLLEIWLSTP